MKKNAVEIIAVIACVLLVIDSIRISRLQNEINNLHSYINNEIDIVNNNINSIYSDVNNMLEKEANQLAVAEWSYGEIDVEKRTAEINCTIVPKVYNPETTKATITCNGQDYDMTYENSKYIASLDLPLFGQNEITQVNMNDNGTIRTQEIDWILEPRCEVLPIAYAGMGGSATGKPGNGEYIWSPQYSVNINIEGKTEFQIKTVELVEVMDGEEFNRTPIDITKEGQKKYRETLKKSNQAVPDNEGQSIEHGNTYYQGDVHFLYYLDRDYHIKNGSMLEFYIDVVDGYGFRYRSFVDCMAITDGQPDDVRMEQKQGYTYAEPVIIFDEAGNKIYEYDPEVFK